MQTFPLNWGSIPPDTIVPKVGHSNGRSSECQRDACPKSKERVRAVRRDTGDVRSNRCRHAARGRLFVDFSEDALDGWCKQTSSRDCKVGWT